MRSIWNGNISFGLVSIPIKIYPATEDHSISFRQIHTRDSGRIRYRKVCELEDKPVESSEIGRAYEDADGALVPITDEDLAALPLPTTHTLEIEAFISAAEIDPLQMGDAYYLGTSGAAGAKPYTLLREALKRSEKVAIAKYAHRGRERLGMLRVVGDTIALHRLLWPDEVREPAGVAPKEKVTVKPAELDLADTLMETLGEVDLNDLRDEYHEALEELVAAKVSGATPTAEPGERPAGAQVVDLMAALKESVRSAREARGEGAGEGGEASEGGAEEEAAATVHELRGRKKAPAKKAAAAKKAPAAAKRGGTKAAKPAKAAKAAESAEEEPAGRAAGGKRTGAKKAAAGKTAAKKAAAKRQPGKRTAS
ncbi:non-homologous end joining protein Ku [Streptomyces rugosispiralis]|uniref:Non-homologous end joining protein Ku n=1 Tax=Streptomyces rugosispiralis TaxID=2967341 RepID=A0ABT1VCJ3_9ACTN|nr:Ku protein [Streptomyces rugosispiralis]MCQ8195124.1 Ku protein [Streptomyces rugosispiralis]